MCPPTFWSATMLRINFTLGRWTNRHKKRPKVGWHMPRVAGNLSDFFSVHYSWRRSHFSAGVVQIVLKRDYNDFSRSAFWYFSLLHFHNYSPTTFYRVQHTAAEAIMLHSSLISAFVAQFHMVRSCMAFRTAPTWVQISVLGWADTAWNTAENKQ